MLPGRGVSSHGGRPIRREFEQLQALETCLARRRRRRALRQATPWGVSKLTVAERDELVNLVVAGPLAAGFKTDLWTCERVAEAIRRRFGVESHPGHVARLLHELGFSPQKQRSWDRRDRLSVIGAVTLSPTHARVGAYFDVQRENVRTDDAVDFLRRLRKKLQRPLIVVWDRWNVHRSAAKRIVDAGWKGIEFELLPAYALELNPVEAMWSHAKRRRGVGRGRPRLTQPTGSPPFTQTLLLQNRSPKNLNKDHSRREDR